MPELKIRKIVIMAFGIYELVFLCDILFEKQIGNYR